MWCCSLRWWGLCRSGGMARPMRPGGGEGKSIITWLPGPALAVMSQGLQRPLPAAGPSSHLVSVPMMIVVAA